MATTDGRASERTSERTAALVDAVVLTGRLMVAVGEMREWICESWGYVPEVARQGSERLIADADRLLEDSERLAARFEALERERGAA